MLLTSPSSQSSLGGTWKRGSIDQISSARPGNLEQANKRGPRFSTPSGQGRQQHVCHIHSHARRARSAMSSVNFPSYSYSGRKRVEYPTLCSLFPIRRHNFTFGTGVDDSRQNDLLIRHALSRSVIFHFRSSRGRLQLPFIATKALEFYSSFSVQKPTVDPPPDALTYAVDLRNRNSSEKLVRLALLTNNSKWYSSSQIGSPEPSASIRWDSSMVR